MNLTFMRTSLLKMLFIVPLGTDSTCLYWCTASPHAARKKSTSFSTKLAIINAAICGRYRISYQRKKTLTTIPTKPTAENAIPAYSNPSLPLHFCRTVSVHSSSSIIGSVLSIALLFSHNKLHLHIYEMRINAGLQLLHFLPQFSMLPH